jgi:hypothetical protein
MSGAAAGYGLNPKLAEAQPAARSRSADGIWQVGFISQFRS